MVGLLVKLFGDHSGIFAELMLEFGKTGRFNYRHAPGIVITAFVSLISGASLGPEAPLADACGGIGTWASDRLKLDEQETRTMGYSGVSGMLAAFITNPIGGALLGLESAQGGTSGKQTYFWVLFPSLLASAVSTVVFVLLSGVFFETLYKFPAYTPRLVDLFYAVPLGLIGGLVGLLFMLSLRRLQRLFQPMKGRVVLRGLIGGLGMGIIGALLPLTLFSGEAETAELIAHAAEIGVVMLIVLGLVKLFATSLLLATGWKGGYIFPIMFASVALGLAVRSFVSRYSSCGRRRSNDGGRARRYFEGAIVCGALYVGPGAERDRGGGCRRRGCQRIADRAAGAACRPACSKPGRISPGYQGNYNLQKVTYEKSNPAFQWHCTLHSRSCPL